MSPVEAHRASRPVHLMNIGEAFAILNGQEKQYAHHLARSAWNGARIILRQVSKEAIGIFEFIMELYACCSGDWEVLKSKTGLEASEMQAFLEYAATFLSNVGNYYGKGDQKSIPEIKSETLARLASGSAKARDLFRVIQRPLLSIPPYSLGVPSESSQSAYYPGEMWISQAEMSTVAEIMKQHNIWPENTRLRKDEVDGKVVFNILQASIDTDALPRILSSGNTEKTVHLVRGDHAVELAKICSHLTEASKFAANDRQKTFISQYIQSFQSGDLEAYRDSQKTWVADRAPRVENIFGFVEPYRDPEGVRAEFEAIVAIQNTEETKLLTKLVKNSDTFIRRLPWAEGTSENNGKGPFEKALFEPPDFTSIHTLAYCSSIIFGGISLPNYNDIRQEYGFKNVMIASRISGVVSKTQFPCVLHLGCPPRALGHGTGKLMAEGTEGRFNFDIENPPTDPLTGKPIISWYCPRETWTGKFKDLATTVDECRAELVGAYLMEDRELLALFGFDHESDILPEDLTYYFYLVLGLAGLRGLSNFNTDSNRWGQAHSRAHFAILRCLLTDGGGVIKVIHDPDEGHADLEGRQIQNYVSWQAGARQDAAETAHVPLYGRR